jgi:hypothetical protein
MRNDDDPPHRSREFIAMLRANTPHLHITRLNGVYEEQHQRLGITSRQSFLDPLHMHVGYIEAKSPQLFSRNAMCTS